MIKEQFDEIAKIINYSVEANGDPAISVSNLINFFHAIKVAIGLLSENSISLQGAIDSYVQ